MMPAWIVFCVGVVVLGTGFLWLLSRLSNKDWANLDADWLDTFAVERYRPMLRLLSNDDFQFLSSECGYDRRMIRRVRAERRRIFRTYLNNLTRDFNRLYHVARVCLLDSPVDRPDLATRLARARITFAWSLIVVQYRLMLHAAGIGSVDVRAIFGSLEHLRMDVKILVPERSGAF